MRKLIVVILLIALIVSIVPSAGLDMNIKVTIGESTFVWTDYDSQIQIQESLNYYSGNVIFTSGNATLWRPLYIPSGINLVGQGKDITTFKIRDAFHTILTAANGNQITVQDASGFHATDMILLRENTQAGAFVIQCVNGSVITLDRAVIFNWNSGAEVWQKFPAFFVIGGGVGISGISIDGNAPNQEEFTRTIAPDRSDPGYKYDWSEAGDAGIFVFRAMNVTIDSVHIFNTQADGVALDTWDYTGTPVKGIAGNFTLKNSILNDIGVKGFESSGVDDGWIKIEGNVIDYTGKAPYHIPVFGGHGDGVIFHDGQAPGSYIINNKISRPFRAGIKASGTYWLNVSNNIITGGNPSHAPYEEGIYLSSGIHYAMVSNNLLDFSMSPNACEVIEVYGGEGSYTVVQGNISVSATGQHGNMRLGSPSLATGNMVIGGTGIWLESPDAREVSNYIIP